VGELILYAIPAFVLLLAVELWSFRLAAERERLGYMFRGPGWSPDGRGGGTRG
jgi:hypothetical protein